MNKPRKTLVALGTLAAAVTLAGAAAHAQIRPQPSAPQAPTTDAYKGAAPITPSAAPGKPAPSLKARGSGEEEEIQPRSRQDAQRTDKAGGKPLTPQGPLAAKPGSTAPLNAGRATPQNPKEAIK